MGPQAVLQRICWNLQDWRLPSGSSTDEQGYLQDHGFGHEEWNFNLDDAVDGFVHGHIPYMPSMSVRAECANQFDVAFWSKAPQSTDCLLVAFYRGAEVADAEDFRRVAEEFRKRGVFDRRVREVNAVRYTSIRDTRDLVDPARRTVGHWLRCDVNRVQLLSPYIPLPSRILGNGLSQRFSKANLLARMPTIDEFMLWRPLMP